MVSHSGTLVGSFAHNTGGQIDVGVETVILALDYISLGLRLWSRSIQGLRYQINDWIIIIATILMTARYCLEVAAVLKCGVGLHAEEVLIVGGPDILVLFPKLLYIVDLLWTTAVSMVKLSILHFYVVVFPQKTFRRLVYLAMFCCVVFWLGSLFGMAFLCTPPQKKWLPDTPGNCRDEITMYTCTVAGDLATDLMIIALPMPILWGLKLPNTKKIPIILAFGLGLAISAITSVRIKYFLNLDLSDATYSIWPNGVLSALVPLLGLLNANLLISRPALKRLFGPFKPQTQASGRSDDTENTPHRFKRLPDSSIPLSNLHGTLDSHESTEPDQVRVTESWEVHSVRV